jgi:predicted AlkP superfamily phosphohydrolase/phosphomutase
MRRVLAIFLDGYEQSLGQHFMSAGAMPEMSRLAASSARFLLDHGAAQRTGLAGEHVATGLSPDAAQRWSAVHFDPQTYAVWQEGTRLRPFAAGLECRTAVFDASYFDLTAAPGVRGLVSWGAHDPGVPQAARPTELLAEFNRRFGPYPAERCIYGLAWPSDERCAVMGAALTRAVDVRAEAACWLLGERLPDWDLALVTVSEPHSAIEGLWHGIDRTHPLHRLPSARSAGAGIFAVHQAVDRLIGKLALAFADAQLVVFSLGGMGANRSDVPSMLLLPELMHRHAFGMPLFRQPQEWTQSADDYPMLPPATPSWHEAIAAGLPATLLRPKEPTGADRQSLSWMPATAYRSFWRTMPAFALPSYYDGRIRLNLMGRESEGMVRPEDYRRTVSGIENLIRAAIDPATGKSAVGSVEYPEVRDPRALAATQADLTVIWKGAAICLDHPTLGRIGPVPYRRMGGHTGPYGVAYLRAAGVAAGDRGIRSAFDVVPTLVELTGCRPDRPLSGESLLLKG